MIDVPSDGESKEQQIPATLRLFSQAVIPVIGRVRRLAIIVIIRGWRLDNLPHRGYQGRSLILLFIELGRSEGSLAIRRRSVMG